MPDFNPSTPKIDPKKIKSSDHLPMFEITLRWARHDRRRNWFADFSLPNLLLMSFRFIQCRVHNYSTYNLVSMRVVSWGLKLSTWALH